MELSETLRREAQIHDELAYDMRAEDMPPEALDDLEQALLDDLGDLTGRDVLELGCGSGSLTLHLLRRGANVTALDISPGMVELAAQRAKHFAPGAQASFLAAPVEQTGLPSRTFDVVCGKWILHHCDVAASTAEIERVLRPTGTAIFIENSAMNPVLSFSRNHLAGRMGIPRLGTEDEHPLTRADLEAIGAHVGDLKVTFPDFMFLRLFDRQVLRFKVGWASRVLRAIDDLIFHRVPALRRYSFHLILRYSPKATAREG